MNRLTVIPIVAALLGSCDRADVPTRTATAGAPTVHVVNYPLQYLARRIAGGLVDVVLPCPPGVDPAFWEPTDEVIEAYQRADVILLNGAGYAGWIGHASLPPSRVVDTSRSFHDQYIELTGAVTHVHGPDGARGHGPLAFTIWLDPRLALQHAGAVRDALVRRWPDHAAVFHAGFESLRGDLETLDLEFDEACGSVSGPVVFSHPVYQYLARRCGWTGENVHWEPDATPDEAMWRELEEILDRRPARMMIWEGAPDPETAARLEQLGLKIVVFEPCGTTPADGRDFLTVMRANVDRLARCGP